MSRYRLLPSPIQEAVLRDHCAHARFVWNLAVEQHAHWHPGRTSAPGYLEQCRQLTQARAEYPWLAAGSQMVQQQALRDLAQAMARFFGGTHGRPSWRKAGRDEGFRVVDVWESREAFEQFARDKLDPIYHEVGVVDPPEIQIFPVHNYLAGSRRRG